MIVCDGRIIGEGYHVRCGEGHAEVNAFASVKPEDGALLSKSTLYVSLEPCSHYGRTPPPTSSSARVCPAWWWVASTRLPKWGARHQEVARCGHRCHGGRAGKECTELSKAFHHVQHASSTLYYIEVGADRQRIHRRPFPPTMISTPFTQMLSHRLRAENDAILVGELLMSATIRNSTSATGAVATRCTRPLPLYRHPFIARLPLCAKHPVAHRGGRCQDHQSFLAADHGMKSA